MKHTKVVERQKAFLDAIIEDFTSDFVGLDVSLEKLPTMRDMIVEIKSTRLPHLSLFHSVDPTWKQFKHRGKFTYLCMPNLAKEAQLMMGNLMGYLRFKYGDGVKKYFTQETKIECDADIWDEEKKCVICNTDVNMELEEDQDEIELKEAMQFLEEERKKRQPKVITPQQPDPQLQLKAQKEAEEEIRAMDNDA